MTLKNIFSILLVFLFLESCTSNPLNVDASDVNVKIDFTNLDSLLVHSNESQLLKTHQQSIQRFGEIYEYELGYCMRMANASDTGFMRSIDLFLRDPYIARLEKRIGEKFKKVEPFKVQIVDAFKYLKFHFPNGKIPEHIVFMNALFNSNAFSTQKQIGIGLESYLGNQVDVVKELPSEPYYEWIKEGMDERFLTRDALCSWIITHYVEESEGNLAEQIVRWGKVLYLTQAAFPETNPAVIMRYSDADYTWAIENEYSLWKYLVDEKMLFKVNDLNTRNMLKEGPFTVGLPEKGPDRLGQFLGLRIIEKFMEANEVSLEKLLKTPYTEILVEYEID